MTQPDDLIPEHGSTAEFDPDEARRDRVQRAIDDGQEEDLSEADYQFAIEHGLIEG